MSQNPVTFTGGCLCGALRYEVRGAPRGMGYCFCADCRRASGSGFIPFINVEAHDVRFTGPTRRHVARAARGGDAVRNFCPECGGLVFGGVAGVDESHTIYAGSLDDPSLFNPAIAIFCEARPAWVLLPEGLTVFGRMPE